MGTPGYNKKTALFTAILIEGRRVPQVTELTIAALFLNLIDLCEDVIQVKGKS